MAAKKPDSFIQEMLKMIRESNAGNALVTFRDTNNVPKVTILIVDAPDADMLKDLNDLTEKWMEDESGA